MKSCMVVLSGGQDSTTCLLEARKAYDVVHAITFDYGQRHRIEIDSALAVGNIVGVDSHTVVQLGGLLRSRSPLVSPAPLETYTDHASMEAIIGNRVEKTFVPLRNPMFLIVAANYALALDCYTLVTGVCAGDNANYPDCTPAFVASMAHMINEALGMNRGDYSGPGMTLSTPLLHLSKAQTVNLALRHGELGRRALAASHTCYAGKRPPCGECHACVLRAEGFRIAGVADPLIEDTQGAPVWP